MGKSRKSLLAVSVICFLVAIGAYFIGREQDRIRSLYGEAPQTISLAQLAEKGYGDNIWVDLTDVEVMPKYVTESRKGTISAVWVAAFPKGQAEKAREIKVILRSTRCKSEGEIPQKFQPRAVYTVGQSSIPRSFSPTTRTVPCCKNNFPSCNSPRPSGRWTSTTSTSLRRSGLSVSTPPPRFSD